MRLAPLKATAPVDAGAAWLGITCGNGFQVTENSIPEQADGGKWGNAAASASRYLRLGSIVLDRGAETLGARGVETRPPSVDGPSVRLDSRDSKVTSGRVRLVSHRCRSRCCPSCASQLGIETRTRLLATVGLWRQPQLLTFTVDRSSFASPEAALHFVHGEKLVARLMRYLGVLHWVRVVEFQEGTGDGWPHWHVLIDSADVPGGELDRDALRRVWSIWRDRWHVGGFDAGYRRRAFNNAAHALRYITKYLVKFPGRGFPEWVLSSRRIRFWDASASVRAVLPVVGETANEDTVTSRPARRDERPIVERVIECGHRVHVLNETVDKATGEVRNEYIGSADIGRSSVLHLSESGNFALSVTCEDERVYVSGASASRVLRLLMFAAASPACVHLESTLATRRQERLSEWSRNGNSDGTGEAASSGKAACAGDELARCSETGIAPGYEFAGCAESERAIQGMLPEGQRHVDRGA